MSQAAKLFSQRVDPTRLSIQLGLEVGCLTSGASESA